MSDKRSAPSASSTPTTSGNESAATPTIISGWEQSTWANAPTSYAQERYAYIGKDETTGQPQWVDYGPKGAGK
eukprot:CAMPEP_0174724748 /NCGR_PEP_ID=MMETSP1094-20130205/44063_1 /TAXON_ID=156173 /ORGANISM="Chrysochromulina brevifilum, Strain UTEX LB 985" /LENGTH=72 /DNA_ID=CAMNT_0015926011 /DNA_START=222 /DNA_END=440 /DNA_ORIENTATION=-